MSPSTHTVGILTLGCKVNQYESDAIAAAFAARGFAVLPCDELCDAYIINTCTVTGESDRKASQFIRRAVGRNPRAYILVTGCFSQTQPTRVAAIEGVDYICGNASKLSVVDAAVELFKKGEKNATPTVIDQAPDANGFEQMHITRFDRTRAYVKIEDGCESRCTYCIIPTARGSIRSKAPEEVLCEVRALTEGGCREIVLTGIETASYGKDLGGYSLADLLSDIDRIPSIGRIRLGSLDPSLMKQPFVDRIAKVRCLAPHFHLSMQSGSDRILALMKRKYNTRQALEGIERVRRAIPEVQFTTDMIVGFPDEREEDFDATVEFAKRVGFLMIHVFPYSKREGTPAAQMPNQIPNEIKHQRVHTLSALAAETRTEILQGLVGSCTEVLFEGCSDGIAHGHTASFIEVECPVDVPPPAIPLPVRLTGVHGNACTGRLISPQPKGD